VAVAHRYAGAVAEAEGALGAELWDRGATALAIDGDDLVAYFDAVRALPPGGSWETVDEVDHVAAYFAGLEPVDVPPLMVAPTHRSVLLEPGRKVVWLDPGMAFGTGHHESTRLALAALGARDLFGARVLDVGSGSGLLAIAADALGARDAVGIDDDAAAIAVADCNARLNRSRARFVRGDVRADMPDGPFDVIVANLYAELHVELMPSYAAALVPGGTLLLSGIQAAKRDAVTAAVRPPLRVADRVAEGEWWLVRAERT
jgi:ribosomal protein L11 methyltransferase